MKIGANTVSGLYLGSTAASRAYLGASLVWEAGGAFDPASLFASGEQGVWYDPSDLSTVFTDTEGTTPATVGQAVARINDKSGRGNHATQATVAQRPILRQTLGGKYYLDFDGVDDGMVTSGLSIVGVGSWDILFSYQTRARNYILISQSGGGSSWAGVGQEGGTGTLVDRGSLSALYFNNVPLIAPTRGSAYTSAQSANVMHWAVDFFSTQSITSMSIGRYSNTTTFTTPGDVFGIVVREGVLNTEQRTDLAGYLAGKVGVTL
jgi:hypothetical protein